MTGPRIGVDVGGTFTDVALLTATGELVTAKVPSTADQSEGVLNGIREACEAADLDPTDITEFVHAMTVSVNALLERGGADTALVTTEGFRDVLEIGRQARPALYDLHAEKSAPLVPRRHRYELTERATTDGIETSIREDDLAALVDELREVDTESVAVAFLHAYAHPENERRAAEFLREALDVPVSASHEVLAEFREFERTATTVADAYVTPTIDAYVGRLADRAQAEGVPAPRVMQSNGGIADAAAVREHAVTTILSGPAAGVVGAGSVAGRRAATGGANEKNVDGDSVSRRAGPSQRPDEQRYQQASSGGRNTPEGFVTFDMGGTSSDVSLIRDGEAERTTDTVIDGIPIRTPMVDIHTIGSGGGSVAWVDSGGALRVGPESAGADPGPACYGQGGERATVTDANLLLGYIGPDTQLGGNLSLDPTAARAALAAVADEAGLDSAREAARGVYRVANAKMTRAIRAVTVERGHDPRLFGLVAFGGAGPMHAPRIAAELGIQRVTVPVAAGVLSAYGLLAADEQYDAVKTSLTALSNVDASAMGATFDDLAEEVVDKATFGEPTVELSADLRYAGQSFELTVPVEDVVVKQLRERFHAAHERAYGYRVDEPIEVVNLRAAARVERDAPVPNYEPTGDPDRGTRQAVFGDETTETPVYARRALTPGRRIDGPAVLEGPESTAVVPPAWEGTVRSDGAVVLRTENDEGGK